LRDKSLAGKKALFDVTVLEASKRTLPEVTDEFANNVRAGLTAESLRDELRKAVDSEDAKEFAPARNAALAKALAEVMDVDVPDTLVTGQAREKFAMMMSDMRNSGVADEEIKKQINPENFLKYKKIVKDDIVKDFKVSMAVDEIGRMEGIEVPDSQVEEQMEAIKQEAQESKEDIDETQIRSRVEATLQRECVMDFLAENGNLELQFTDGDEEFDEELMAKLAQESLAREESLALEQEMAAAAEGEAAAAEEGESAPAAEVLEPEAPESEDKVAPELLTD
jgi:trigger factor